MIIYLTAYTACMLFSIVGQKYVELRAVSLLYIAVIVSVLVGFRAVESGLDTEGYYSLYEQVLNDFHDTWLQGYVGYIFYYLSEFAGFLGGDASYLTFFYALLTCLFIFYTLYRYGISLPVSVAYFFTGIGLFFFMHNVMRQALAVSIIFYSVSFIRDKKLLKFIITTTFAVLVHASAVFFIPFYFLSRLPIKGPILLLAWLVSLPFIFFTGWIVSIIQRFSFLVPNKYIHYLTSQSMYEAGGLSGFGLVLLAKQGMFFLIWFAYRKEIQITSSRVIYLLAMYAVIIGNIVLGLGLIGRFNEYLFVFMLLALPMAVTSMIKESQQTFCFFIVWGALAVIFLQGLLNGAQGVSF